MSVENFGPNSFTGSAFSQKANWVLQTAPSTMTEMKGTLHRPSEAKLAILQEKLGYRFRSANLLLDALTHSSFSEANNELLHVLGAKVVQQAVAAHFILTKPQIAKGKLEQHILEICSAKSCASDALDLGLESLIMVSKGVTRLNEKILSGALYAICGAIALDDGPTTANFVYWTLKKWNATDEDDDDDNNNNKRNVDIGNTYKPDDSAFR